jgi:hypothetical protein
MEVIEALKYPTRAIVHFRQDEEIAARNGARHPLFQVTLDPDPSWYSPCGNYVRFNSQAGENYSEIHGWICVDDILVDSVLAEHIDGEWKLPRDPQCTIKMVTQAEEVAHG